LTGLKKFSIRVVWIGFPFPLAIIGFRLGVVVFSFACEAPFTGKVSWTGTRSFMKTSLSSEYSFKSVHRR